MTENTTPQARATGNGRDPLLTDGYRRLGTGGPVPLDLSERVTRGVRARRRRQRVVGGLAAAAVLAGGAGLGVATLTGGGGQETPAASDRGSLVPTDPRSTLTLSLPDGSSHRFDDVTVTCDPADLPDGVEPQGTGSRIFAFSDPYPVFSDGDDGAQGSPLPTPLLYLELRLDEVQGGGELRLPIDTGGDSTTYPVILFAAADAGAARPDEANSAELDSRGTATVVRASCEDRPDLALDVDAILGSEVGQQPLELSGTLR